MKGKKQSSDRSKKEIKVVHISSPLKVETNASKFRALVQQLTGKDSDATRFMDTNDGFESYPSATLDPNRVAADEHGSQVLPWVNSYNHSSSSSPPAGWDSNISEPFDRLLPPAEGSFMSMFQSISPHEPFQRDVFKQK